MHSLSEDAGFARLVGESLIIEDNRPATEWGREFIKIPNSARSSEFDVSTTPHLREPIDCLPDNRINEAAILMPIGSGKTTVFDVHVPRAIKEDPGSILLTMQTDEDADEYWDERLEPILLGVPSIKSMADAMPRNKRRKGEWILPHLTLYVQAAKLTAFQRKSVRWVFLDEAWRIKHGLIQEARGRTHRRWNARVVLVSQGGWTHVAVNGRMVPSELDTAWLRTDQRRYHLVCPQCGTAQVWRMSSLRWIAQHMDDGRLDERGLMESTRYACAHCPETFPDKIDIRRALASASIYRPTNPHALPGFVGWHCNALALYWQSWGELALAFHHATQAKKLGDSEPLRIFVQKQLAENWREESDAPEVVLKASDYSVTDYADGQLWDGESHRFMTIDRQRDHFWYVIRAWKNDGASRLLSFGRLLTTEQLREKQLLYRVPDKLTFEDAQYDTGGVYDDCAEFGWTALHGTKYDGFDHRPPGRKPIRKPFSTVKQADAPTKKGKARYIMLATDAIKDVLAALIAGRGQPFEHPADIGQEYETHMRSETKRPIIDRVTKRETLRWAKITSRSQNHGWDCETYQVAVALMFRILKHSSDADPATVTPESTESVDSDESTAR